jgi:hypothetical protein
MTLSFSDVEVNDTSKSQSNVSLQSHIFDTDIDTLQLLTSLPHLKVRRAELISQVEERSLPEGIH